MSGNDKPILIYSTFPSKDEARQVGAALVQDSLAACVNIIPGMMSVYVWDGKVEEGTEAVMLIKTIAGRQAAVIDAVARLHSYDNPAIIVLPIEGGASAFLDWIAAACQAPVT